MWDILLIKMNFQNIAEEWTTCIENVYLFSGRGGFIDECNKSFPLFPSLFSTTVVDYLTN